MALYLTVIFEVALPPVVGFIIGMYLDEYLGTSPIMSLIFLSVGMGTGVRRLLMLKRRLEKR